MIILGYYGKYRLTEMMKMTDKEFRAWLKTRLLQLEKSVKAPQPLKDRIQAGINLSS